MFESQRQHPAAALAKALEIIRGNFITILVIIFVGGGGDRADFTLYWILGTIICLLIWGVISWFRFKFQIQDGELQIEQGVLVHKKLYLAADRIQVIDISSGIVQRLFGLVAVEVKTAGSTSKEAKISALSREKAEELKALLRKESSKDKEADRVEDNQIEENVIYSLNTRDLLIAATTSGRLGVALSLVAAVFSQVDQLFTEQQIFRFVEDNIPHSTSATIIVFSIIAIFLISWVISFLSTIIKYYGFSIEVKEKELLITKGLFERTQLTIPFNRIQAVQIKEGILRQPFGYASLVIESAGYGETAGNSTVLFPLIAKKRMYKFINEVIPEYYTEPDHEKGRLSRRALRRYLLRMFWLALVFIIVVWSMIPYGIYAWFILLPALLLGYLQYLDAGINHGDDTLILSSRFISKTTAIIKKYRMQSTEVKQNPFQARLRLSNFTVHVASGNQGRSFTIRELTEQQAYEYLEWISNGKTGK